MIGQLSALCVQAHIVQAVGVQHYSGPAIVNEDGEVDAFMLWPIERVLETIRDTDQFKFNSALVIIDFLVRHGYINSDDPDYVAIVAGLHN